MPKRLMSVELGFVLAPHRIGFGIGAGLLPARFADYVEPWSPCAGDQGEAMLRVGFPDPVAADFDNVAEPRFALLCVAHGGFRLGHRALDVGARLGLAIGACPLVVGDGRDAPLAQEQADRQSHEAQQGGRAEDRRQRCVGPSAEDALRGLA